MSDVWRQYMDERQAELNERSERFLENSRDFRRQHLDTYYKWMDMPKEERDKQRAKIDQELADVRKMIDNRKFSTMDPKNGFDINEIIKNPLFIGGFVIGLLIVIFAIYYFAKQMSKKQKRK